MSSRELEYSAFTCKYTVPSCNHDPKKCERYTLLYMRINFLYRKLSEKNHIGKEERARAGFLVRLQAFERSVIDV